MNSLKRIGRCVPGHLLIAGAIIWVAYLLLVAAFHVQANRILFPEHPPSYKDSDTVLKLTAGQGQQISAVYLHNPDSAQTLLYSHGPGEDLGDILPRLHAYRQSGYSVFAYDYPGFGTSDGNPSREGVIRASEAAYQALTKDLALEPESIIAYGRSLGTAPAVDLAARYPVGGLIVEGGFTSGLDLIGENAWVPGEKFPNMSRMANVTCPVLVIHGTEDRFADISHGKDLLAAANHPKTFLWVQGAGEADLIQRAGPIYWNTLRQFSEGVREIALAKEQRPL